MQHPLHHQQQTTNVTTEQIQKYLDENKKLILAIMENQNLGKLADCAQYQAQLQKNLMYLAAIADDQSPAQTPTVSSLSRQQLQPQQSAIQHGVSMMQQSQAGMIQQQQQTALFGSRLAFNVQSNDQQQSPHMQFSQAMVGGGGMGMRVGTNVHPGHGSATHLMMDAQDGSQPGYGDGEAKSSGPVWANRDS